MRRSADGQRRPVGDSHQLSAPTPAASRDLNLDIAGPDCGDIGAAERQQIGEHRPLTAGWPRSARRASA